MWRWVRDRAGGYAHAVPAGFTAPAWYAVCLQRITAATAVDTDERAPRVCTVCRATVHQGARLDAADRPPGRVSDVDSAA